MTSVCTIVVRGEAEAVDIIDILDMAPLPVTVESEG